MFPRQFLFSKSIISSNFWLRELHLPFHDNLFFWLFNSKYSFEVVLFEKEGVTWDKSVWSKRCLKLSIYYEHIVLETVEKIRTCGFLKKKIEKLIFSIRFRQKILFVWLSVMVSRLLCNHTNLDTVSCQISWICSSTLWVGYNNNLFFNGLSREE